MGDYKFTRNGKKVCVIGKLNNEQWICQEIFVANGQEFPAGENFVETTLLDSPAETYTSRETKRLEAYKAKLESEIKAIEKNGQVVRRKLRTADLINRATQQYQNVDIEALGTFLAFISGEITHVLLEYYGDYHIKSLIDAVESVDNSGWHENFDGLKLVSIFGCSSSGERYTDDANKADRSFNLKWKINQYRDGSGSRWDMAYPCKSYEEAVSKLDSLLEGKGASAERIKLKDKYKLINPTQTEIDKYRELLIENKQKQRAEAENRVVVLKAEENALRIERIN